MVPLVMHLSKLGSESPDGDEEPVSKGMRSHSTAFFEQIHAKRTSQVMHLLNSRYFDGQG